MLFKKLGAVAAVSLSVFGVTSTHAEMMTGLPIAVLDVKIDKGPPPKAIPIDVVEKTWKCPGCTPNEKYVLKELQKKTNISDRNALATILGNIKSESNFHANICEGGARVPYNQCHSGGYGLIQWTSIGRYKGLGNFCRNHGCDPSSLEGQVRYMINEPQFQKVLPEFEGHGQPVHQYMVDHDLQILEELSGIGVR